MIASHSSLPTEAQQEKEELDKSSEEENIEEIKVTDAKPNVQKVFVPIESESK